MPLLHDYAIINDDTLKKPAFIEHGQLQQFDIVLANPPYSISQWDRSAFENDKYGRNFLGTPSQGIADFAFLQHILKSMDPVSGRCAVLLPRGILSRYSEIEMRRNLVQSDLVECVVGVGKGLFYNSPMEACVMICRMQKPYDRCNKVLIINASKLIYKEGTQSFLSTDDISRISDVYHNYVEEPNFSRVVSNEDILKNNASLSITLYIPQLGDISEDVDCVESVQDWISASANMNKEFDKLISMLGVKI